MNPVLILRALVVAIACCLGMSMPYSDRRTAFADRMTKFASPQPRTRSLPDISPAINMGSSGSSKMNSSSKDSVSSNKAGHGNRRMNSDLAPTESPDDTSTVNIKTLPGYWIKDPTSMVNDTFGGLDYRTEVYHIDDLLITKQP